MALGVRHANAGEGLSGGVSGTLSALRQCASVFLGHSCLYGTDKAVSVRLPVISSTWSLRRMVQAEGC